MVILIFCIILVIILLIPINIKFSRIKLRLINFKIENYNDLKTILKLIKNKDYIKIFDYLDFILKLQLYVLNKIPIFSFKVSDDQIAKFLRKQIKEHKLKKEEQELETFEKNSKKQIDEDLSGISLESLDLNINLGTENSELTAISTSIFSILISIILPFLVDRIKPEKYRYKINPVYIDEPVFDINASLLISMPAKGIRKLLNKY